MTAPGQMSDGLRGWRKAAERGRGMSAERGAALIVVVGILAVLIVISATFWQLAQQEIRTATNVANRTRAGLIANGGFAIAKAFLNHDRVIHPSATSVDHAWRTYFNGAAFVGKPETWAGGVPLINGGIPEIDAPMQDALYAPRIVADLGDSVLFRRDLVGEAARATFNVNIDDIDANFPYVVLDGPTPAFQPAHPLNQILGLGGTPKRALYEAADGSLINRSVSLISSQFLTPEEQIHMWADVDNNGDGLNDSIWLPIAADAVLDNDGLDNNLNNLVLSNDGLDNDGDGVVDEPNEGIDEPGERGYFLYRGGNDGLDNNGNDVIDEDAENIAFLTTFPFLNPDGTPNTAIYNSFDWVSAGLIPGVDTIPPPVDVIDNDYSMVVNDGADAKHLINFNFYPDLAPLGPPGQGFIHAEPVSIISGRVAIYIVDEASKVNINAAGGRSFDAVEFLGGGDAPMRIAFNSGINTHEYALETLPELGPTLSDRIWNIRMGGPGGVGMITPESERNLFLDPTDAGFANFDHFPFDVSLPGYGRVDDDGNAIWLSMNGLDDDGDGLIDEGLNPALPDYLLDLEGIDEPAEFQPYRPRRNGPAERDGDFLDGIDGDFDGTVDEPDDGDNDDDGITDEIGELGDRFLRTNESIKFVEQIGPTIFRQNRPFITAHSSNRNERFNFQGFARTAPQFRSTNGIKLDYRYARPNQIAEMLQRDFGYGISTPVPAILTGNPFQAVVDAFTRGLRQEDTTVMAGSAANGILGLTSAAMAGNGNPAFPSDPLLRTYQLGVNVKDFGDADHVRTETRSFIDDTWWQELAAQSVGAGAAAQIEATRQIYYTHAGLESIRINEVMVRPVRRVEAEATTESTDPIFYDERRDPNVFSNSQDFSLFHTVDLFGPDPNGGPDGWGVVSTEIDPVTMQPFLGVQSALAIYNVYTNEDTEFESPNIMQFSFQATPQLPAGRYYLVADTTVPNTDPASPTAGQVIPTVFERSDFSFQFRVGTPTEDILNDPDFRDDENDNGRWRSPALLGRDGQGNLTGRAFLQNDLPDLPDGTTDGMANVGFTVEIPPASEGLVLHVAIRKENPDPDRPLAINFFEFSQEPDHEWVEVANIARTGNPIDLSGWQLVVEGEKRRAMTIPAGTLIAPGGSLLLAVNKFDFFAETEASNVPTAPVDLTMSRFFFNGIGLARGTLTTLSDQIFSNVSAPPTFTNSGSVFERIDDFDFLDRDGNAVADATPNPDQTDVISTPPLSFGTTGTEPNSPDKAWDRIVQLIVPELEGVITAEAIGRIVLDGGIFPNEPEFDGVDNDGDRFLLANDFIDNDGDGTVDENTVDDDEGTDEGRFRRLLRRQDPTIGVPGGYHQESVVFNSLFAALDPDDPNNPNPYLGTAADPPQWKAFVEERLYPGDNVIITLYQGNSLLNRVVDRVTYTQQDVENRAIDDIQPIPEDGSGNLIRNPLDPRYASFWPDNTMGVDFYRTIERRHPLYNGDKHGWQNRFQATDGNYDDWSDSTGRFERIIDGTGALVDPAFDRFTAAAGIYNLFAHAYFGSPLRMNLSQRLAENPNDQFAGFGGVGLARRWPLEFARVQNSPFVSPGDLVGLPHFDRTDLWFTAIEYGYLFDLASVNQRFDPGAITPGYQDQTVVQALIGQVFPQALVTGFDFGLGNGVVANPDLPLDMANLNVPRFNADVDALIGNGPAMHSLELTPAQADVYPLISGIGTPSSAWPESSGIITGVPETWVPVSLYPLPSDLGSFPSSNPVLGFESRYLLVASGSVPPTLDTDRWPEIERASFYVSGNFQGVGVFNIEGQRETGGNGNGAETLFVWDGADGLENGEYDVFVGIGEDLSPLLLAHLAAVDLGEALLDPFTGLILVNRILEVRADERIVDIEIFTDRNGDRRLIRTDLLGLAFPTQGADLNRARESFGMQNGRTPNVDGFIHYGVVQVENNMLGLRLRNWSRPGTPVTFSRVILAPRKKTPGRININTVASQFVPESSPGGAFNPAVFNPLVGLPGLLPGYNIPAAQFVLPTDVINPPTLQDWSVYEDSVFNATGADPTLDTFDEAMLYRANQIALNRTQHVDGRYYEFPSDLAKPQFDPATFGTRYPQMLTGIGEIVPGNVAFDPACAAEMAARFQRIANLITTRSDVFEIIVTAQAGYGVDVNGDGRINYRSDEEFVVTAEKQGRQVYER